MKYLKLEEIANLDMGKTPARNNLEYWNGNNTWVSISDLKDKYISESKEKITDKAISDTKIKEVPENTLIISFKLSIGKKAITTKKLYTNEAIMALKIKDKNELDVEYLYYALEKVDLIRYTDKAAKGKTLNKEKLKKIEIPICDMYKQKKIVESLNKVKMIISKQREQLELLENLKKSQFFEMFGDPIKNEKGWENYKLNEIYEIIDGDRGKNYPKSSDFSNKGFCLFLNAKNVTKEGFKFEETNYISQEKDRSMGKGKLERGDIVLTTRGTLGNLAIYGEKIKYPNIRINSGMVILRKIDKTLEDKYFIEYLKNSRIIEKIKSGTAQPQIPILHLKKIKISVPPIILQNKFATKIEAIQKLKFEIEKSLKETENLYNSLMQKFFSNK